MESVSPNVAADIAQQMERYMALPAKNREVADRLISFGREIEAEFPGFTVTVTIN
jgi:hypothetical protein